MAHTTWYTGNATANTWVQDFSPLVMAPPLPGADISLWPIIGKMNDGKEITKFEWIEEPLTGIAINCAEALDTTETTITVTTADALAAGIRVGAMLKNATDKTKKEVILVTAIDSATAPADLTVTRDYGGFVSGSGGGTTGETHTSGDDFEIIGYLNYQGSGPLAGTNDTFATRDRSPKFNYYSILDDFTRVAAEDLVREYRGSSPDNWGYQLNGIRQRLDRIFERHLISSPQVAYGAGAQGSMGGLLWYMTQTTGADDVSYISTAENFDYDVWDAGMEYLYGAGGLEGNPDLVTLVPPRGLRVASKIHESAMRGEYNSETVRGLRCTTLMSSVTGDHVPLVPCRNIPSDSFAIVNLNAVRLHFLQGYGLAVLNQDIGVNMNLYKAGRLVSMQTMEFQRPVQNSYFHDGITWSLA